MKKRQRNLTLIRLGSLLLAALVLGSAIYNWNAKNVLGNQMPMPFGVGFSVVLSGSMEPALSVNDLVIIRETDAVEENDIIVFQSGSSLVIHRVLTVEETHIVTKGDANNTPDSPISPSAVKGRMVFAIPGVGGIFRLVRQPLVTGLLLAAALLLAELSYRKEKDADQQELEDITRQIQELMKDLQDKP